MKLEIANVRRDDRAGAAPRPPALSLLSALVSWRTWLATLHLLAGFPVGIVSFTLVVVGLFLGVGLMPVFLVGVLVLIGVARMAAGIADLERGRFALFLGQVIAPPPPAPTDGGPWRRLFRPLQDSATWRQMAYCLLWFVVGGIGFAICLAVWSLPLALVALPAYNFALPGGGASFGPLIIQGPLDLGLAVLAGVAILLAAPWVVGGLAALQSMLARALLGPGRRALEMRVAQLEDTRARAVGAAEAERMRIERNLHDGAQQRLVSVAMELGRAQAKFDSDPGGARELLDHAHAEAKEALVELRQLVRGLRPPVLEDRGLDAAVSGLAARSPIPIAVTIDIPQRPSLTIESIGYFVVAESLANVAKHAHARQAWVDIHIRGDRLRIRIQDDGVGGADPRGGGLTGLADRVASVDGMLRIESPAGGPTVVEVELPCVS